MTTGEERLKAAHAEILRRRAATEAEYEAAATTAFVELRTEEGNWPRSVPGLCRQVAAPDAAACQVNAALAYTVWSTEHAQFSAPFLSNEVL